MGLWLLTLASAVAVEHGASGLRHRQGIARNFVQSLEFKRRLRVCNAYPYPNALNIFRGADEGEALTKDDPMLYKTCRDFEVQMTPGDKLVFKVGSANAGTFAVSDLPNNDAVLLLVIYRHDTLTTAVSFESHVYSNLLNAQVAVVDTFKGPNKAVLRIQDHEDAKNQRSEELRFDSVVAVNPGKYDIVLEDAKNGETITREDLVALNREGYIVMRVGVDAQQGTSYSQELVVYPKSDPTQLSGCALYALGLLALLLE